MKYCKRCVLPDTRPYVKFDSDGVCYPCRAAEQIKKTNWSERWKELESLADRYRGMNGDYYDCMITVSGGKDSYYQTYLMKEKLGMNPLLVSIDNFSWTDTGRHNFENLSAEFGVDVHTLSLNGKICKQLFREAFFKLGSPTWYFDKAIYSYPLQLAEKLNLPLIVYGEDTSFLYGGPDPTETPSAKKQLTNDVVKPVPWDEWNCSPKDVNPGMYPKDIRRLNPVFLSYYVPWSGYRNMEFARTRGFRTLEDTGEWIREGFLEQYDQIDCMGYLVHPWMKFPKFGHARVTDVASLWIRERRMTRKAAVEHVIEDDWRLDREAYHDFIRFTGISKVEFWNTVDKFANKDILEKRDGCWRLKPSVEEMLHGG